MLVNVYGRDGGGGGGEWEEGREANTVCVFKCLSKVGGMGEGATVEVLGLWLK